MQFGALKSKYDCRDYKLKAKTKEFPKEFTLDFLPKVKDQTNVSSCVAHALSSVVEYFNKKTDNDDTIMSTGFIYGNRDYTVGYDEGLYIRDALKTLAYCGDVPYEDFSYNIEVPTAIRLYKECPKELKEKALENHISGYYRLYDAAAMKEHLMNVGPIVFAINWYDDYTISYPDRVLEFTSKVSSGGHCMFIYGWNDKGWLFQNSWGYYFGGNGRAVLPYDVEILEAWGVTDDLSHSEAATHIIKPKYKYLYKIINFIVNTIKDF